MFWRKRKAPIGPHRIRLSLFDSFIDRELWPGDSLSFEGMFTIWAGQDGVLDICPPMTDKQMEQRTARDLYASRGVTLHVVDD